MLIAVGVPFGVTVFLFLVYGCWPTAVPDPVQRGNLVQSPYLPFPEFGYLSSATQCWCKVFGLMEGKAYFFAAVFFSIVYGFFVGSFGTFCVTPLLQYKNEIEIKP